jgi:hypothetical protein
VFNRPLKVGASVHQFPAELTRPDAVSRGYVAKLADAHSTIVCRLSLSKVVLSQQADKYTVFLHGGLPPFTSEVHSPEFAHVNCDRFGRRSSVQMLIDNDLRCASHTKKVCFAADDLLAFAWHLFF